MNFETMSKQRKMILIAAAVGVIAMFLPWWSLDMGFVGGSINGMHNEGLVVFLCFLGVGALAVVGDQSKNLGLQNWMLVLLAGALAALITLIVFVNAPPLGNRGFGLYIALIAAAGILFFAYTHRTAGHTLQNGFDSLKQKFGGHTTTTPVDSNPTTKVINPANDPSKPVV